METAAPQDAARALLAFWRAAGVDMDEAEAVFAARAATAAPARNAAPAPLAREPFRIDPPTPKAKPKAKLQPADDAVKVGANFAAIFNNRAIVGDDRMTGFAFVEGDFAFCGVLFLSMGRSFAGRCATMFRARRA